MANQKIFLYVLFIFSTLISSSLQPILPGGCIVNDLTFVEVADFDPEKDFEQAKELLKENWQELVGDQLCTDQLCTMYADYFFKDKKSANYRPYPLILKTIKNTDGLIGFIGYVLYDSANNDRDFVGPFMMNPPLDSGHIEILAINSAYRKKGLAKKLIDFAIQDLTQKGAQKINVGVHYDNKPALNLYHKSGFFIDRKFDDQNVILAKVTKENEQELIGCGASFIERSRLGMFEDFLFTEWLLSLKFDDREKIKNTELFR